VTPDEVERDDGFGGVYRVGQIGIQSTIDPADLTTRYTPFPQAIWEGFGETWFVVSETVKYVGKIIVGREPPDALGGPITVARAAGEAASMGLVALLALAAYLSVSVGFVNLLPIPLLDGGHLLYFAFEAVRKKPLSERAQEVGFRVGFAMVMALILFALALDLGRLS
jgi:regulator of sigma E protease